MVPTNAEGGVNPAAIVEQGSYRLLVYSSAGTPEEQVRYWLQRAYIDQVRACPAGEIVRTSQVAAGLYRSGAGGGP